MKKVFQNKFVIIGASGFAIFMIFIVIMIGMTMIVASLNGGLSFYAAAVMLVVVPVVMGGLAAIVAAVIVFYPRRRRIEVAPDPTATLTPPTPTFGWPNNSVPAEPVEPEALSSLEELPAWLRGLDEAEAVPLTPGQPLPRAAREEDGPGRMNRLTPMG